MIEMQCRRPCSQSVTGTTVGRTGKLGGGWGTSLRLFLVIIIITFIFLIMIAIIILFFTIIVIIIILLFTIIINIMITCMETRAEK